MTQQKAVNQMTREELEAALANKGVVAKVGKSEEESIETDVEGDVGMLEAGLFVCIVAEKPVLGKSNKDKPKIVFTVECTETAYAGTKSEVHASPGIAARYLKALGVEFTLIDKHLKFNPSACVGKSCKVKFKANDAGYIRPDGIFPLDYEDKEIA